MQNLLSFPYWQQIQSLKKKTSKNQITDQIKHNVYEQNPT